MPPLANPKHEIFCQQMAAGKTQDESYVAAGYAPSAPNASRLTRNDKIQARIAELQCDLFKSTLVDAQKLHKRWSDMFEADIADIMTEDGHYRPVHQWPKIWRQMLQGCDVKELFERSKDGQQSSWDKVGEVVKLKFVSVKDLGELLGRHRAVAAFVEEKQSSDTTIILNAEQIQVAQVLSKADLLELRERIRTRLTDNGSGDQRVPALAGHPQV